MPLCGVQRYAELLVIGHGNRLCPPVPENEIDHSLLRIIYGLS